MLKLRNKCCLGNSHIYWGGSPFGMVGVATFFVITLAVALLTYNENIMK